MAIKVIPGALTDAYKSREGDFAPDLVGFQFTKSSALFTLGNFSLTTNTDQLTGQVFNTGTFSDPISLDSLTLSQVESQAIEQNSNTLSVTLNNNKNNFLSYVYFGESKKFLETEISGIINSWKGSLYIEQSNLTDTVVNYSYNQYTNETYFSFSVYVAENIFSLSTGSSDFTYDENNIGFLQQNYLKYEIKNDYGVFPVIGYTGNSVNSDYINLKLTGNVWPSLTANTSGSFTYHLKPNDSSLQKYFFSKLSDFQNQLLNRLTVPQYTLILDIPYKNELGYTFTVSKSFTWPTSDGFNLDVDTRNYGEYLDKIFGLANDLDANSTSIMTRKLVASSILEFDSEGDGTTTTGRKMDKLLKIWGREYDEVKRYIDGISFANVVTYDGKDNTPDELIKILAQTLGFDTIQTFSNNDLVNYLATTTNAIFSGQSRSLSIQELDTELWKRLVINAWWLFRSKGTRKVIEFFLNLFRIDECLIDLNEYVYLVEQKIDYLEARQKVFDYVLLSTGIDADGDNASFYNLNIPIDRDGYPLPLPDTSDYYFQMGGFWYNGGTEDNTKPNINGNNPHYGPYDYGEAYFNKFRCFVDNFNPLIQTVNLNQLTFNYFKDYTYGSIENSTPQTLSISNATGSTVNLTETGTILTNYNQFYAGVMNDNSRVTTGTTVLNAGKTDEYSNTGNFSFKINFSTGSGKECEVCPPQIFLGKGGTSDGLVTYLYNDELFNVTSKDCCDFYHFYTYPNLDTTTGGNLCYWCPPKSSFVEVSPINGNIIVLPPLNTGTTNPTNPANPIGGPTLPSNPIGGPTSPSTPVLTPTGVGSIVSPVLVTSSVGNVATSPVLKTPVPNGGSLSVLSPKKDTVIYFTGPDGTLIPPNKDCCTLRGYSWNYITKKCVTKVITTDTATSNDAVAVL